MHFILDGRVGIMIPADHDRTTRVRSLGRYTTIGEMGLVSQTPRSATIQAEVDSVLYVLNTHQFDAIKTEDPALSHKLLTYFVSVMAERLTLRTARSRCSGGSPRIQKRSAMCYEQIRVLERCAVSGVGIQDELRITHRLEHVVGVDAREH